MTTRSARGYALSLAACLMGLGAGAGLSPPLVAQGEEAIPIVQIATAAGLQQALAGSPDRYNSRVRLGLLAAQGPALTPMLQALIRDESQDELIRANALTVLALQMDSSSVTTMIELTARPGPLRTAAFNALAISPYPEACVFWREILREANPDDPAVTMALGGIRYCGTSADITLIETALRRVDGVGLRKIADRSIELLRQPTAERYRRTQLEGNYPPTGTYRPPPQIAAEIRARVCDGPCAPGLVLSPSDVARIRN